MNPSAFENRVESICLLLGSLIEPLLGDANGDEAVGERVGVTLAVGLERDLALVKAVVLRWTRIPGVRRSPTTVTSNGLSQCRH
jgi:hypothetical protein